VLAEERYLQAARATYGFMNQELWDEGVGVYRSAVNAQVSEYTPMTIGAAIGAMRENTMQPDQNNFPPHTAWIHLHFSNVRVLEKPDGVQIPRAMDR